MDIFDEILPEAPAARGKAGGRFAPKAKSKWLPRRDVSASEHETSSKDGQNEHVASSSISTDTEGIAQNESHDVALVDALPSTITLSEFESDPGFTNLEKSACEKDLVASEVGRDTNNIPETDLSNGSTQPIQPANAIENLSSNAAAPPTTCSNIGSVIEPPKDGKGSFLDSNEHLGFELDPFNVLPDPPGTRTAHRFQPNKIKPRPRVGTKPAITSASSNVMIGRSAELPTSCTNEVQSFQSSDNGSGGLNQSTNLPLPTSEIPTTSDLSYKFDNMSSSIPFSEDNINLAGVIPSERDSPNAMHSEVAIHNGASFGKSAGENADIFSGLESLDDSLAQAATDKGEKPAHEKGTEGNFVIPACSSMDSFGVCDTNTQVQRFPEYHTTQDSSTFVEAAVLTEDDTRANNTSLEREGVVDLSAACPVDDVLDYQSKSGTDPTSEIPVHEEHTKAADNPTLADILQDANESKKSRTKLSSLRKCRRSSIAKEEDIGGKTSRQQRKQAAHKPVNNSMNEEDDDLDPPYPNRDELEEIDDEFEVDYSSKKKTKSTSSTKKTVTKNGKTSQKRKKADEDSEHTTKEPHKKFSHSTRRKKRCVDKALLEIPEDELDYSTLPMKDIILLAEYRERQAKKEAATAKTSSTNQSDGDSLHETGANSEEEILGSEDDRESGDDQASENIPLASSLFNYQSFMDKAPRGKWSKQDTELFYEAVRQFGTDFSMIQQLFPDRTRHQIKLKYKKEERQHPLELADAINNRAKDHTHFKLVIERLQQASTKADQDLGIDGSDFTTGEEVEDLAPGANDEVATTEQDEVAKTEEEVATTEKEANVKDQEDSAAIHSPEAYADDDNGDDGYQYEAL